MSGAAEFAHLDPHYRRYAALSDRERIQWIQADRWIGFDQAQAALDRLSALLDYPARDRMPCLLIFGDTGMGKTKIVRKFERAHPPVLCQATGVTRRPVVVAQIPPEPVERDLYRELLASLNAPALAGGTLAREKDVCRSLLRTVEARMIVLDEVNGMLAGTYRQQRVFLNALRFLANDLRAPLVCAGTDLARQALLTDAQLAERFEAFHLGRWKNDRAFARLAEEPRRHFASATGFRPRKPRGSRAGSRAHGGRHGPDVPADRNRRRAGDPVRQGAPRVAKFRRRSHPAARVDDAIRGTARRESSAAGGGMMSGRRLPVAPRPYRDELISSWLGRVACRYGLDAASLVGALAADGEGDARGIPIDDAAPLREDIVSWAQACGVDPARLSRLTLARRRARASKVLVLEPGPALGADGLAIAAGLLRLLRVRSRRRARRASAGGLDAGGALCLSRASPAVAGSLPTLPRAASFRLSPARRAGAGHLRGVRAGARRAVGPGGGRRSHRRADFPPGSDRRDRERRAARPQAA